jgi:cytidine deaminase
MASGAQDDLVSLLKQRSIPRIQSEKKLQAGSATVFSSPQLESLEKLAESIGKRPRGLKLSQAEVVELQSALNLSMEALLREIALIGKQWSSPPISKFEVAAVGLTYSGAIYIGVNLEFHGLPLFYCVHGEQFLITRLKEDGEQLKALAVNAPPCGHCRQFLKEVHAENNLVIYTYGRPSKSNNGAGNANEIKGLMQPLDSDRSGTIEKSELAEALVRQERTVQETYRGVQSLLPLGFGPDDLLPPGPRLLNPDLSPNPATYLGNNTSLTLQNPELVKDELVAAALEAAKKSYCPYSESPSGVALVLDDGFIASGSLIESAAYNPTLSSVHCALINCYAFGGRSSWTRIKRIVLVEKTNANVSQITILNALLDQIAPSAIKSVAYLL